MVSSGSLVFVGFNLAHPGGRRDQLGSFGYAMSVVMFIRACPGCRKVHSGS